MRRLMFVLVAMLTAVAATASTALAQRATAVTQPVVTTLENPCDGEIVLVEGTIHSVERVGTDEGGGEHLFFHRALQGTGIGLTSGAEYRVQRVELDPGEVNFGPERAGTSTDALVVHIIGREPGNSFYAHINHHSGVSASGQTMPFQINAHTECR